MPGSLHLQHLVKMSQIQPWRGLVREGGVLLNNYTCKMYVEGAEMHVGFQRKGTLPEERHTSRGKAHFLPGRSGTLRGGLIPFIPVCVFLLRALPSRAVP